MRQFLIGASVAAGVITAGLNVAPSGAQPGSALITQFTAENVKSAITGAGGEYIETKTAPNTGYEIIYFNYEGRKYFAAIVCTQNTNKLCFGLELVASFGTKDVTIPLEAVNQYNFNHVTGKAIFIPSTPALDNARFLSAIGGITSENVVWEIKNFHAVTDALLEELKKASVIASTKPSTPAFATTSAPTGSASPNGHVAREPLNTLPR
jgi:hypothetical protein